MNHTDTVRIDKWLWCARFFKTRSLAAQEIDKGRVAINGQVTKASREVRVGDTVALRQGQVPRTVVVRGVSHVRGPAPVAQQLYEETAESRIRRETIKENRRLAPAPGSDLRGRPTKKARRQIRGFNEQF